MFVVFGIDLAGAVSPQVPNVLVVDRTADPFQFGDQRGVVFVLRYRSHNPVIGASARGFVDPVAVIPLPDRTFYVLDSAADPLELGEPRGCVWHVDPSATFDRSVAELVAASALFVDPADFLLEDDGRILVADRNADPFEQGGERGAIFRVDPESGNVDLVTAHRQFVEPRSIARDLDGTILVLDGAADPLGQGTPIGALFRLHPGTGAVVLVKAFTPQQMRAPTAVIALPSGDYVISDRDADPNAAGSNRGALFLLRRDSNRLETWIVDPVFSDPIDLVLGVENDIWVLDESTDADGAPSSRGGTLAYDLTTRLRTRDEAAPQFRSLAGIGFVTGAALDSSTVFWRDETGGVLSEGDIRTVDVTVRSTGTDAAIGAVLTDTLAGDWVWIAGSATASAGNIAFDREAEVIRWEGDVPAGDEVDIRYRMRLRPDLDPGHVVIHRVHIGVAGARRTYEERTPVTAGLEEGSIVFVDRGTIGSEPGALILKVDPESPDPIVLWVGNEITEPLDSVFLEDGTLAVLDRRGTGTGPPPTHAIFIFDPGLGTVRLFWQRTTGDGLVDPNGIALDRDGTLLLVDRDANPFGYPYQGTVADRGPGAVYRLSAEGLISPWFGDSLMREPIAIAVDSKGIVAALDFAGRTGIGDLWEFDRETLEVTPRALNPTWFRDPLGFDFDVLDAAVIADLTHFNDEKETPFVNNGTLLKVNRGGTTTYQILSQSSLLVDPSDCYVADSGILYITDRDADPLGLGEPNPGAVFKYDPRTSSLEVASASFGLERPVGPTGWPTLNLSAGALGLTDRDRGDVQRADTLDFGIRVINNSSRRAKGAMVDLVFTETLEVVDVAASLGTAGIDVESGRATWTGELAPNDTLEIGAVAIVRNDASYGEAAAATANIYWEAKSTTRIATRVIRAPFRPGDLVVVDETADPNSRGNEPGAVFGLGAERGEPVRALFSGPPLLDPAALEWTPDGTLLVADRNGAGPGIVYRFDAESGDMIALTEADSALSTPVDLLWSPEGDLIVIDRDAPSPYPGNAKGAVFRFDGIKGPAQRVVDSPLFRSLAEAAFDDEGRLFLTDRAANPDSLEGNPGAIFMLDLAAGAVVDTFQFPALPEPTGIALRENGTFFVTDAIANPQGSGNSGTLFTFNPDSRVLSQFLITPRLRRPIRTYPQPNGKLLILDQIAAAPDQVGFPGLIHEYDPIERTIRDYASCDSFRALADLTQRPTSRLVFARYGAEDPSGAPLYPADILEFTAVLGNTGALTAEGSTYRDEIPLEALLIPGTLQASSGNIVANGNVIEWVGEVAPGDSVVLTYSLQLDPLRAEGKVLDFHAEAEGPFVGRLEHDLLLPVFVPLEPGNIYLADAGADPLGFGNQPGAILKIDQRTGSTGPYLASSLFREPIDITLVGTTFYVADQVVRLPGIPGRGVVFAIDTATLDIAPFAADSTWLLLSDVEPLGEDQLLVLDTWADPFSLVSGGSGPGALYSVSLATGDVEPIVSDTAFVSPRGVAVLPSGEIAIVDAKADPLGLGFPYGAVFLYNPVTRQLRPLASDIRWVELVAVAPLEGGDLLVVDRRAIPDLSSGVGCVWRVTMAGEVSLYAISDYFADLSNILIPADGRPILTDVDIAPNVPNGANGALLRQVDSAEENRFVPLASTSLMSEPSGLVLYQDATPIVTLRITAAGVPEGISLDWDGFSEQDGTRYLVYRRIAEGASDDGEPWPEGYELLPSDETFRGLGPHHFVDSEVERGGWYAYRIAVVYPSGEMDASQAIVQQAPFTLLTLSLAPARPNPFRTVSGLRFTIPAGGGEVTLTIHDVSGRRVRALVEAELPAGVHQIEWDGKSDAGHAAASGLYFVRLTHHAKVRSERIVLLR